MATVEKESVPPEKNTSSYDADSKTSGAFSAIAIAILCIVIGVPLWWKTTEVYRVSLPYSDIDNLRSERLVYSAVVKIVVCDDTIPKYDIALFGEQLQESWRTTETENIKIEYQGNLRFTTEHEKQAVQNATSLNELDKLLQSTKDEAELESYTFYVLPKDFKFLKHTYTIGLSRNIFVQLPKELVSLVPLVVETTRKTLVNENELDKLYFRAMNRQLAVTDKKENMRAFHSHPAYDITFTLINPDPSSRTVDWNIERGIESYLTPLTNQLSQYVDVDVKSEILFYVSLPVQAQKDSEGYYLQQNDLPHLINPIEGKLASHVSSNPAVHFVTYLPHQKISPLRIQGSTTNAFFSPRWGGMFIYNTAFPSGDANKAVEVDVTSLMEVFIPQLRMLLGLQAHRSDNMISSGDSSLPLWQLDSWLRSRTVENIVTASLGLKSLAQLLEKIPNIVINDEIGHQVMKAVQSIHECEGYLQKGLFINAYHSSQSAIAAAEKAFFDPSLLELLYFPEDQKFAIYIPLFLPISLPVLLSAKSAIAHLRKARREGTLWN